MNYLAHAYLSFGHPEITVGNLISDFVKGKAKFNYPIGIQQGIALHREIDTFTDNSEATKKAKEIFRPAYRLYSAPFTDIIYDHFLALDNNEFSETSLLQFTQKVYTTSEAYQQWLPENFSRLFPYMKTQNWLYNYRTIKGIRQSFEGMVKRSAYLTESRTAATLFEKNYEFLKSCYEELFAEIKPFAKQRLNDLITS